eukprot:2205574-Alexandrium_andersonii.AAC.1
MRTGTPLAAQPDATLPAGIQAVFRFRRPHPVVHQLSKFVTVLTAWLAEEALVGGPAVVAHQVLREQLPRMLHQPEHDGM